MSDGNEELKAMRSQAMVVPLSELPAPDGGGDRRGDDDGGGDDSGASPEPEDKLPENCPVIPLGVAGDVCFYLDALNQYREVKAKDHSRLNVQNLFGTETELLYQSFPRMKQEKDAFGNLELKITGWKPELAAEALMHDAAMRGTWTAHEKLRGGGAWRNAAGELVLHVGDALLVARADDGRPANPITGARDELSWTEHEPGIQGDKVYPTQARLLRPHPLRQNPAAENAPAKQLLAYLQTWNWRRPEIDPYLALGQVCASKLSGALKWRPVVWLTGPKGCGKSSLLDLLSGLAGGPDGMLKSPDPSPAAIRQVLRYASLPVAIDEAEAAEDNSRMNALVSLARNMATGALTIRGGSNHEASTFQLWSCMWFSSILQPPLSPQDRSRMAILDLKKLTAESKAPKVSAAQASDLGSRLLRRLMDQWHRADATIEAYRAALAELELDARSQDVYGTLLGCADLALYDAMPQSDSLAAWQEKLRSWVLAEQTGNEDDSVACLNYLLTTSIDAGSDRRRDTVGNLALIASGYTLPDAEEAPTDVEKKRANKALQANGLVVVRRRFGGARLAAPYLAVPNKHTALGTLFQRTIWAGKSSADGVWKQSLARLVDDRPELIGRQQWVGGGNTRATFLPFELIMPKGRSGNDQDLSEEVHLAQQRQNASAPAGQQPAPQGAARESTPAAAPADALRPGADTDALPPPSEPDDPGFDLDPDPDPGDDLDGGGLDAPL
jgi:energy-coupling factor transporter ATP-binding protein EcfA2